ncbi:small multidrug efflux protein [Isoptericola cucumis]|uniref:small multidrug efflux protein n=1 Tax=Isoptericola cucumis TaxID=1776856 RepID=UPI00320A4AE4
MNPVAELVTSFQELVAQVPEIVRPFVVMLAGVIPFVEGEGAAIIGVVGGLSPVVAAVAAAAGNFLSVLLVVLGGSRARSAAVSRREARVGARAGAVPAPSVGGLQVRETERTMSDGEPHAMGARPESKGRRRLRSLLVRFGVPGASLLGPLVIPTQFTAAVLVASGVPRRWVLLWQAAAIVVWTTVATVSVWLALQVVAG